MAEFKRLSDVEVVAEPTESANVLIEENGVIKKAPKDAVGGGGSYDAILDFETVDWGHQGELAAGDHQALYNKIINLQEVKILVRDLQDKSLYYPTYCHFNDYDSRIIINIVRNNSDNAKILSANIESDNSVWISGPTPT